MWLPKKYEYLTYQQAGMANIVDIPSQNDVKNSTISYSWTRRVHTYEVFNITLQLAFFKSNLATSSGRHSVWLQEVHVSFLTHIIHTHCDWRYCFRMSIETFSLCCYEHGHWTRTSKCEPFLTTKYKKKEKCHTLSTAQSFLKIKEMIFKRCRRLSFVWANYGIC